MDSVHLFDKITWYDPVYNRPLVPIIHSRDYVGRPHSGALQIAGTKYGYPIVYGVPRITPELANKYYKWLKISSLLPPPIKNDFKKFQAQESVASFGFQWSWDAEPRTDTDLLWRIAVRHGFKTNDFKDLDVLDAGAGAGDQSRWLLNKGAKSVVSVDLSESIEVAYKKLEKHQNWMPIQGDLSALPFLEPGFDFVYCEGVIQHTKDSNLTVSELIRVLKIGGMGIATHYLIPKTIRGKVKLWIREMLRKKLCKLSQEKLLIISGILSVGAHIPFLGYVIGNTIAVVNPRMPSFKATWSCTYDTYGSHSYQRHIKENEFLKYFVENNIDARLSPGGGVIFKKRNDNNSKAVVSI